MEIKEISLEEFTNNLSKHFKSNVVLYDCPFYWDGTKPYTYFIRVGKRGGCHIIASNGLKLPVTSISDKGIRHVCDTVIPCGDLIREKIQRYQHGINSSIRSLESAISNRKKELKYLEDLLGNHPELLI